MNLCVKLNTKPPKQPEEVDTCLFIDVYFTAARLPEASFISLFLHFCVCPSGGGQAGGEEGGQGRGQRDPHEGAGEATEGGIHQENTPNVDTCECVCDARWCRVQPCYAAETGRIS